MHFPWAILLAVNTMAFARIVSLLLKDSGSLHIQLSRLAPTLNGGLYKGQAGRVAVMGGSRDYTGAPFFAAAASLRFGGDLAYVFCEQSASLAIKSYSPELMVTPFYGYEQLEGPSSSCDASPVFEMLPRLHSLVVGPGLGRNSKVFVIVQSIIESAVAAGVPLVIDADGLYMLETFPELWQTVLRHSEKVTITPNKAEFERLCKRAETMSPPLANDLASEHVETQILALSQSLAGATVLLKGRDDLISNGADVWRVVELGSPRRCGGQGDLLAGSLGVAAFWAASMPADPSPAEDVIPPNVLACVLASIVVKRAARLAFQKKLRGTTTPDILEFIAEAFQTTVPHYD